jgi:hypothetical protein
MKRRHLQQAVNDAGRQLAPPQQLSVKNASSPFMVSKLAL